MSATAVITLAEWKAETAPRPDAIELRIPEPTPSLNELRRHWRVLSNMRKKWEKLVERAAGDAIYFFAAKGKRRLTVRRHSNGTLDIDNFIGGLKSVIDALRKHKLIVDDNRAQLELVPEQVKIKRGEPQYTVLTLEDL